MTDAGSFARRRRRLDGRGRVRCREHGRRLQRGSRRVGRRDRRRLRQRDGDRGGDAGAHRRGAARIAEEDGGGAGIAIGVSSISICADVSTVGRLNAGGLAIGWRTTGGGSDAAARIGSGAGV